MGSLVDLGLLEFKPVFSLFVFFLPVLESAYIYTVYLCKLYHVTVTCCILCIPLQDCMYLHELGDEAASFTKEDMQQG